MISITESEIDRLTDRIWAELWHLDAASTPPATEIRAAIVRGIIAVCVSKDQGHGCD
jgi:hypothetical protein